MPKKAIIFYLAVLLMLCFVHRAVNGEELKPVETLISEITPDSWIPESMTISPDGKHWAFVKKRDGKEFVVTDGRENKEYGHILRGCEGYIVFSPDSKRMTWFAEDSGKQFAVIDGEEGKRYEKAFQEEDSMLFSPDSKRVVYIAEDGGQQFLVRDGKEGNKYKGKITTITFSPDSKRDYYLVHENNKVFIVIDGKEGGRYDLFNQHISPYFSPDSKRIAYSAVKGRKWVAVVDGVEGPEYDDIFFGGPLFSPDCKRVAYSAMLESGPILGEKDILNWESLMKKLKEHSNPIDNRVWESLDNESKFIINGWKPGEPVDKKSKKAIIYGLNRMLEKKAFYDAESFKGLKADWIDKFMLGKMLQKRTSLPDIQRVNRFITDLAFPGEIAKNFRYFPVVDGKEGKRYDLVLVGQLSPSYSPDGKSFSCLVKDKGKWFFATDGKDGQKYDLMFVQFKRISPDDKHSSYMAVMGGRFFMVIDGKEGQKFDRIVIPVMFSPDSKRTAYAALSGNKAVVVVDGKEGKAYDFVREYILSMGKDGRDIPYTLPESYNNAPRYMMSCNTKWKMKCSNMIFYVAQFSPDSSKVVYVAEDGGKLFVVLDGKEGKPYDNIKTPPYFTPDGKYTAYTAVDGKLETVVAGEEEQGKYDMVFNNREKRSVFFDSPGIFHFFAMKNGKIIMVTGRMAEGR